MSDSLQLEADRDEAQRLLAEAKAELFREGQRVADLTADVERLRAVLTRAECQVERLTLEQTSLLGHVLTEAEPVIGDPWAWRPNSPGGNRILAAVQAMAAEADRLRATLARVEARKGEP